MTAVFYFRHSSAVIDRRYKKSFVITVSLISLGCAKNLVDSEIMIGHLHQAGMKVIPEAEKALPALQKSIASIHLWREC